MTRAFLGAFVALGAIPAIASGGTYDVPACSAAVPGPGAWLPATSHPGTVETVASCGAAGRTDGLVAREISGPINTPGGARAEWVFTAAPGTRIVGVTAQRWASAQIDDGWRVSVVDGAGRVLEQCAPGPGAAICDLGAGGPPGEPGFATFGAVALDTDRLGLGISCQLPLGSPSTTCTNGPGTHFATFTARDLVVTISDPTPPVLVSANGPLRPAAGRWVRGTGTLQVAATDAESGVARVGLLVNGTPAATALAPCRPERPNPCAATHTGTLSLDTRSLPDGPAELRAFAEDSGQERATGEPWTLRIDNSAPAARPDTPAVALAGQFLTVRLPSDAGSPISRVEWRFIPAGGGREYRSSAGAPALGSVRLTTPPVGRYRLAMTLTDAAGNRGAETQAPITVRSPPQAGVATGGRILFRRGKLVALLPVAASARARSATVTVRRSAGPQLRLTRTVAAGRTSLTVPLGRPASAAGRVVIRWRFAGVATSFIAHLRAPARPRTKDRP